MLEEIEKCKKLQYSLDENYPPQTFNTLQIYTAEQILNGIVLTAPPSLLIVKRYRKEKEQMELFNH